MTMPYDRPNHGALFRNKFKYNESDCDYSGTLNIDGSKYSLSGWLTTSKNGVKFIRLSIRPKREKNGPGLSATITTIGRSLS